jgi:SAM-dependent methyltransferase
MSASHCPVVVPGAFRRSKLFGIVAPGDGWVPPLRYLLRRERVLRLVRRLPRSQLLEIGCGAGALLDDFERLGFQTTGFETSTPAFEIATRLARESNRLVVQESDTSWRSCFDVVCAFDVLEHIEDDNAALAGWLEWLRPGGSMLLSVPAHRRLWNAGDEWAGHWRRYDRADLVNLLHRNDLVTEHLESYGFPLANIADVVGQRVYKRMLSARSASMSKSEASAFSGIERTDNARLFHRLDTPFGRFALRGSFAIQALSSRTSLGNCYLVLARRR